MINHSFHRKLITASFLATVFAACSFLSSAITYYDATTYKNLTDLKPRIVFLYESFAEDSMDVREIRSVRLQIAQMVEYEKGKGPKNRETFEQMRLIQKMFESGVEHRRKNGKWSSAQRQNEVENISDAFDIAISTERLKNKNE